LDSRELYSISREFLDKEFDMKLEIPIFINNRMKTTYGYFQVRNEQSWKIEMSKEFIDTHPREHIIDVLKHELVHYACFEQGMPWRDKDKYFKDTLDRLGVSRTRTYHTLGKFHRYTCNCGKKFDRKRKLSAGSYCGECKTLRYVGIIEKSLK
jgi:SprT-like protein